MRTHIALLRVLRSDNWNILISGMAKGCWHLPTYNMKLERVRQDIDQTDSAESPSVVPVQHGAVIAHFGADQAESAADAGYRITEAEGMYVDTYEFDRRLPPSPGHQDAFRSQFAWHDRREPRPWHVSRSGR